jgi:hypothetical protein
MLSGAGAEYADFDPNMISLDLGAPKPSAGAPKAKAPKAADKKAANAPHPDVQGDAVTVMSAKVAAAHKAADKKAASVPHPVVMGHPTEIVKTSLVPKASPIQAELTKAGLQPVVGGKHQAATAKRLAKLDPLVGKIEAGNTKRIEARETLKPQMQDRVAQKKAESPEEHALQVARAYAHQGTLADKREEQATARRELDEMKAEAATHRKAMAMTKVRGPHYVSAKQGHLEAEKDEHNEEAAMANSVKRTEERDSKAYLNSLSKVKTARTVKGNEGEVGSVVPAQDRKLSHAVRVANKAALNNEHNAEQRAAAGVSAAKVAQAMKNEKEHRNVNAFEGQARADELGGLFVKSNGMKVSAEEEAHSQDVEQQRIANAGAAKVLASLPKATFPSAEVTLHI